MNKNIVQKIMDSLQCSEEHARSELNALPLWAREMLVDEPYDEEKEFERYAEKHGFELAWERKKQIHEANKQHQIEGTLSNFNRHIAGDR